MSTGPGWLDALADEARRIMPAAMATYVDAGAREQVTRDGATAAWAEHRLAPRVLVDVSVVRTETRLLGQPVSTPIGVAPTALQRLAHHDGERAMAAGAASAGALHVVSSNAGWPFEEIAAAGGPWWLQVYLPPEREQILPALHRAAEAGASALVLTGDTPMPGTKYAVRDQEFEPLDLSWVRRNLPTSVSAPWARDLTPHDIGWLEREVGLPVVVKGVLRPDDACLCAEAGAKAVWVSNHGGRQLDRSVASAHALAPVVEAVLERTTGDVEVYVDGGVRSGLDALTALALGADAVFVGRPALWALAVHGAEGVQDLIESLNIELVEAMRLSGSPTIADIRGLVVPPREQL